MRFTAYALASMLWLPATGWSADFWSPVSPGELSLKAPKVDKDASAEVLFWETKLENDRSGDGYGKTTVSHYLRIKIFTDKGRDEAKIEVPYYRTMSISNISGRTIKSDGTIRDLKGDAIFDKDIVKTSGLKVRAKTFVLPDVAAGDIIEYRYRQTWPTIFYDMRLAMQQNIPVQKGVLRVRPMPREYTSYSMHAKVFHGVSTPFTVDREGYSVSTFENIPAYHEEPYMPPEDEMRTWMLVFYSDKDTLVADKFWNEYGKKVYTEAKPLMKVNEDIKRESARIVGDASTPDDKLRRIYDFCQTKIKNSSAGEVGVDDRKDLKVNKTPADTLRQGMGTGPDIDNLFAALAIAAGFEARPASTSDRSDFFLDPNFPNDYFLNARNIAVRVDDKWRFFDPANRFVPFGMLRWQEEFVNALVSDPKQPEWVQVLSSPAEASKIARYGKFKLSEDGTLEGDVRLTYTGHEMIDRKRAHALESTDKREKEIEDSFTNRLPGSDATNIKVENPDGVSPLIYSYHVKVPGYAQRTGKRLFLQPAFFQRNTRQRFTDSERKFGIYFDYPWTEEDYIEIEFPTGYLLDHPDAPGPITVGKTFDYKVSMKVLDKKTLVYHRNLMVDGIMFPPKAYASLKSIFDAQFKEDEHLLTLKQDGPSTGGLQQ